MDPAGGRQAGTGRPSAAELLTERFGSDAEDHRRPPATGTAPHHLLAEQFGRDHETWEAALAALKHEVSGVSGRGVRYGPGNTHRSSTRDVGV